MRCKLLNITIAILLTSLLSGCATVHYVNGESSLNEVQVETEWRHNFVLGLIEAGEPIDLQQKCDFQGWTSVKTGYTVSNALAYHGVGIMALYSGYISPLIVKAYFQGGSLAWFPLTAEISCKQ